jgi:hypothetical protein
MSQAPVIDADSLRVGIKGLFFSKGGKEVEQKMQPPVMPYSDANNKNKVQMFLSNYFMNSFVSTFLKENEV